MRSLLKFGVFSTRYKDIYDMYYQCGKMNIRMLTHCLQTFILDDSGMRENSIDEIVKRVESVFGDDTYRQRVDKSDKRWLDDDINNVFNRIVEYLRSLS